MRGTPGVEVTRIEPARGRLGLDPGAVWRSRELLYFLCWRSLKVRYKQAVIGVGWMVLQPLLTMVVFWVIFGVLVKVPSEGVPYPVFALSALLPWTFFQQAVARSGGSLVADASLLTKVYFPRILIPLAACTTPLFDFLPGFLLLLALMAWHGMVPGAVVMLLPLFLLLAWFVALAMGLWLAPLNVRYRDVGHALPFLLQLWMYGSPVLYSIRLIPEEWRFLYGLNPMVGVIQGFRWALLGQAPPDARLLGISGLTTALVLLGGSAYFRRMERTFADVI